MSLRLLAACIALAVGTGALLGTLGPGGIGPSAPEPERLGAPFLTGPMAVRSIAGEKLDLRAPAGGATVVVFYSVECPIALEALPTLAGLRRTYSAAELAMISVCVDPDRSGAELARHAREHGLNVPVVSDPRGELARRFGVAVVPEVFVLLGDGRLGYRGRVDDRFTARGRRKAAPPSHDLIAAVAAVLDGRPAPTSYEAPVGCPLPEPPRPTTDGPTYSADVAPILRRSCLPCHRPGQSAPFSLLSFAQAAKRAGDIAAVVEDRLMPPWKPVPGVGLPFRHDRSLLPAEVAILRAWADAGAPMGDEASVPPPPEAPEGWALGEPDLVLEMAEEFAVPATGGDLYRCFILPTNLPTDRYITAIEVQPGNSRVVHHTFGYIDVSGRARERDRDDPGPGYECFSGPTSDQVHSAIGGWTPGNEPHFFGDGIGLALPRGADVVMQVHYHPSGKPETDRTRLGLHFARGPVRQALQWFSACADPDAFVLPPDEPSVRIRTRLTIPLDVELHALTPHMHLLGREITASVTFPDGGSLPLIAIDDWDFNRQDTYYPREPLALPRGSVIHVEARYDNSGANLRNPRRPPRTTHWGEATTDEMLILFMGLTLKGQDLSKPGAQDDFKDQFFRLAGGPSDPRRD